MKRHVAAVLAAVTALTLTITGCGGDDSDDSSGGKVVLSVTVWNYSTTPEFKVLFDAFEAENPDIDIKPVDILADDYPEKVTTMLAGGDSTDVLTMKNVTDYSRYALRGQLAPLTEQAKGLDATKYAGLAPFNLDGEYFALPYRQDFWVLYYNKTLLKNAGVDLSHLTWDQYAALAKQVTKGSGDSKVYGTYHHTWRSVVQAIAAAQTGGDLLGGDYGFMKDQYSMALDLQDAGAALPWATASTQKISYNTMFSTEKTAMLPMGTWYAAQLLSLKASGETKVDWGIAPMPQRASDGKTTTFGSPTAFAVNKKAKHADAAKRFVAWASGTKGANAIAKIGIFPAYRDEAIINAYFSVAGMPTDEVSKLAFQPTDVTLEMPVSEKASDVDTILTEEHELIMVGDKSIDAGLAEMGKRVKSEVN